MTSTISSFLAGDGTIFDRDTNSSVKVHVVETQFSKFGGKTIFKVVLLEEDFTTVLGRMSLQRPTKPPPELSHIKIWGNPWIHRNRIDSYQNERYRGVGTLLTQVSSEVSHLEGFGGAVCMNAIASHAAHYKMGFRFSNEELNTCLSEEIKKAAQENRRPDTSEYKGFLGMHLPKESIAIIAEQIRKKPTLTATKEKLLKDSSFI